MPVWARDVMDRWRALNHGWEVMVHGPAVVLPELQDSFDAAQSWSSKSDLMRYSALWKHGGWYFDVDFWPMRPLDDLLSTVRIDQSRVVISRQQGHKSGDRMPFASTPLACTPAHPMMARIIADASDPTRATGRLGFGPALIKEIHGRSPHQFSVMPADWFFPWSIEQMPTAIPYMLAGQEDRMISPIRPIAAHMWADAVDISLGFSAAAPVIKKVAVIAAGHAGLASIATGLNAAGWEAIRAASPAEYVSPMRADIVVGWNDTRSQRDGWTAFAEAHGAAMIYVEHGWFDRATSVQMDCTGIQHRASWAGSILGASHPVPIIPTMPRKSGYILVLGQVDGDSQLDNPCMPGASPMLRQVCRAIANRVPIRFRPHPSSQPLNMARYPGVELSAATDKNLYRQTKAGGPGLAEDLAGARFVVSINSTSLLEAAVAGIPCLAFGPAIGLNAGAFHAASPETIASDLHDMLAGWVPPVGAVDRLVGELWAHQHSPTELSNPEYISGIIHHLTTGD